MKVYLGGIGGTFMAGLAQLMKDSGLEVSGCDTALWPPMSTQLERMGIEVDQGWDPEYLGSDIDQVIIGNVLSRGNPLVEAVLDRRLSFTSGPQWLSEHILLGRQVLAVAGTHGKTTTTAMLAWILSYAKLSPGFLLGGLAKDFKLSAQLGDTAAPFVIEADEYDTAFFDKRPKFMHYQPQILIVSNIEFDHADIYADIEAIKRQFHYLLRLVPSRGKIIYRASDENLQAVMGMGVWTACDSFGLAGEPADWTVRSERKRLEVFYQQQSQGYCQWGLLGEHNALNAVSAIAAAYRVGVPVALALAALGQFQGVSRRLEVKAEVGGITVYDDFAHHPTEIHASLTAVKQCIGNSGRVLAVFEPRSNSMRMGVHKEKLQSAFSMADKTFLYQPPDLTWKVDDLVSDTENVRCFTSSQSLLNTVCAEARSGDSVVVMSNGAFDQLPERIGDCLSQAR